MAELIASKQAKLPYLDHLTLEDFEYVYEPAEDTYLLCDALENDVEALSAAPPARALEIGCGSGCVITYFGLLTIKWDWKCRLFATDINAKALQVMQGPQQLRA